MLIYIILLLSCVFPKKIQITEDGPLVDSDIVVEDTEINNHTQDSVANPSRANLRECHPLIPDSWILATGPYIGPALYIDACVSPDSWSQYFVYYEYDTEYNPLCMDIYRADSMESFVDSICVDCLYTFHLNHVEIYLGYPTCGFIAEVAGSWGYLGYGEVVYNLTDIGWSPLHFIEEPEIYLNDATHIFMDYRL